MSTNSAASTTNTTGRKLLPAALTAVAAATAANLIARLIMGALVEIPASFPPLQLPAIAFLTVLGTGAAALVYGLVRRFTRRPARAYLIISGVALILSILPNLGFMANPASAPFPGGTAQTFGLLIVFHLIAAVVSVGVLLSLTRPEPQA